MESHFSLLKAFGLSEKESKILQVCMQMSGIRAAEISKRTGIERTNVYKIIEVLMSKGYISLFKKDNVTYYRSLEPRELLAILKKNTQEFEKNISLFESNYKQDLVSPKIELFSGRSSVQKAITSIINKEKDYCAFGGVEQAYKQNYFENLPAGLLAEEKKIKGRVLLSPKEKAVILTNEEYRVSNNPLPVNVCTVICDNLVAIFNWGENCNVIFIKDKSISRDYALLFENLWANSKTITKDARDKISLSNLKFNLSQS